MHDVGLWNVILADHINKAIKEAAIIKIKDLFREKGVKVDSLDSKKIAVTSVTSPTLAYQYIMYSIESIEKKATAEGQILLYKDLEQIPKKFSMKNGKTEIYRLNISNLAREAATNVLYLLSYSDLLDKMHTKFNKEETKVEYYRTLNRFLDGVRARSYPTRSGDITTNFRDSLGNPVIINEKNDKKTKKALIANVNKKLGKTTKPKAEVVAEEPKLTKKITLKNSSNPKIEKKKVAKKIEKLPTETGAIKRVKA